MVTLREIAEKSGYGLGTVSRAIKGTGYVADRTRNEILQVAESLGYKQKVLKKISTVKSRCVGVLLTDINIPFFARYLQDIQLELSRLGYYVMYFSENNDRESVAKVIDLLQKEVLCGLIFNVDLSEKEVEILSNYPVVSFERIVGDKIPVVASGHKKGGRMAAKILLENRCMHVLILTEKKKTPVYADLRISECQEQLMNKGVRVTRLERSEEDFSYHRLEEWIEGIFAYLGDVDGIFTDDVTAYYCIMQAKKRGISVPNDLKIIGYDGNDITRMVYPRITTFYQNVGKLAARSVEILKARIEGQDVEQRYYVEVKLKQGGSTL